VKRRVGALWLVLFAVYAATIGLDAFGRSDYAGDEPHYLLTAKSIVEDGNVDLTDEYRDRAYRSFYPRTLEPHGVLTKGRLNEPHGVGLPLLIAPAFAIGGEKGVEIFLAALAALAVALAYRLALRVVPDPWALGATVAVGLSPPLVAYSTAVYPELPAAAAMCAAALLALRIPDRRPSRRGAYACFALIGLLPWLGPKYLLPGAVIALFGFRELRRARRPVLAITSLEVVGFSVALYVGLSEGLYGGPTPYSAELPGESATDAAFPLGYVERAYRLVALLIDRDYGLLRWAPVFALALFGALVLWRERRSGIARVIPGLRGDESAALVCGAAALGQVLVAAFLAPTMFGFWFPGRHLVAALPLAVPLLALGVRRAPRVGALLAVIGVAASVWVYLDVRLGGAGLVVGLPDAPWGPLVRAFPRFTPGSVYPFVLATVLAAAAAALVALDWRHSRQTAGATRFR
jgi:4-amino-4-deoxy-L-arabinose transferase-like glycosyltransferase